MLCVLVRETKAYGGLGAVGVGFKWVVVRGRYLN